MYSKCVNVNHCVFHNFPMNREFRIFLKHYNLRSRLVYPQLCVYTSGAIHMLLPKGLIKVNSCYLVFLFYLKYCLSYLKI